MTWYLPFLLIRFKLETNVISQISQCACSGCALRICQTFPELACIRRLTVVPHGSRPPPYLLWGEQNESDAGRIFRAMDIVNCSEDRGASRSETRRVAGGFVGVKGRGMFIERVERNWIFLKLVSVSLASDGDLLRLTTCRI
jgi:hypothetical protein